MRVWLRNRTARDFEEFPASDKPSAIAPAPKTGASANASPKVTAPATFRMDPHHNRFVGRVYSLLSVQVKAF
jgi:hypothetical protein